MQRGCCEGYDSPIEHIFAMNVFKYINDETIVDEQHDVETRWGKFRLDFLLENGDRKLAVECDGKAYHQDEWRDEVRDALILGVGSVYHVLRIPGSDLYTNTSRVFFRLAHEHPWFFTDRAREVTSRLVVDRVEERDISYALESLEKSVHPWRPSKREHWRSIYSRALAAGPIYIDHLIEFL